MTLGLNLNSPNNLYKKVSSPWSNESAKGEPHYSIPECFNTKQPSPLNQDSFSRFSPETLFYIFYSMPKDEAQLFAANELIKKVSVVIAISDIAADPEAEMQELLVGAPPLFVLRHGMKDFVWLCDSLIRDYSISPDQVALMTRHHDFSALQNYEGQVKILRIDPPSQTRVVVEF
ncbi:hypothetical protein L1987_00551 [Smallanthus sonchifolius]|uniref:Uncharacterized protein n=1 Tax=Smallanthus sonchifolius TaxID=185202 RepID=A0ACB9K2N1_9ASTR|nr:hypothetical protein L1987_00551 [Smallanthus sonchifolius]